MSMFKRLFSRNDGPAARAQHEEAGGHQAAGAATGPASDATPPILPTTPAPSGHTPVEIDADLPGSATRAQAVDEDPSQTEPDPSAEIPPTLSPDTQPPAADAPEPADTNEPIVQPDPAPDSEPDTATPMEPEPTSPDTTVVEEPEPATKSHDHTSPWDLLYKNAGLDPESAPTTVSPMPSEPAPVEPAEASAPLAAGAVVADRFVVLRPLTSESAAQLLGVTSLEVQADFYAVDDKQGYRRCWSCGSTANEEQQRFCVDCGAPLQHREVVLAHTTAPTGEAEEFTVEGAYYHLVQPRKQFGASGVTLEVGGFSAEGPHHPNEDSYWSGMSGGCYDSVNSMFGVVALADGMGGYAPGSGLISKEIVSTVGRGIFEILHAEPNTQLQETDLQAIVRGAIAQANGKVLEQINQHGEMGATLVTAVISGQIAFLANIGDSRAYYIAPSGAVTQITQDQSLVAQQVAAGFLSPDAAYTAFGNNVILHAIGEEAVEEVLDWYAQPLEPGSRLLLCTDGYWKTVQHAIWNPELSLNQPTLRYQARALVENALALNSDDNTTVVLIGID